MLRVTNGLGGLLSSPESSRKTGGESDLDERLTGGLAVGFTGMGNTLSNGVLQRIGLSAGLPFDHPFGVNRTRFKLIKTMPEGMLQMIDVEVSGATLIGAVQERTIVFLFLHAMTLTPGASFSIIGDSPFETFAIPIKGRLRLTAPAIP